MSGAAIDGRWLGDRPERSGADTVPIAIRDGPRASW